MSGVMAPMPPCNGDREAAGARGDKEAPGVRDDIGIAGDIPNITGDISGDKLDIGGDTPDIGGDMAGNMPGMGDDMAGDNPGMAGDIPIMGCGEPTPGNKVGSYEGKAILFTADPSAVI